MLINDQCKECILKKYTAQHPEDITDNKKAQYRVAIVGILEEYSPVLSAPEILEKIAILQKDMFDYSLDLTECKKYYNALLLSMEDDLWDNLMKSADFFDLAIGYAMTGNYIDFGANSDISEEFLKQKLAESGSLDYDKEELENLRSEILKAKHLVFLTDNCGEIVTDKLLIRTILKLNPKIDISAIVRGADVLNDATLEDARDVGLDKIVPVHSNGTAICGTAPKRITLECQNLIENADVIISKGMGNFETMYGCGKNVYYLLMCKCDMFAKRFKMPLFSCVLKNEKNLEL
ncbi:MAG: DUF89 family protein [Clostridia bacterium]|nr:DUF89 family protein [Clostridia bacterium]